jgi:hypothetical protein
MPDDELWCGFLSLGGCLADFVCDGREAWKVLEDLRWLWGAAVALSSVDKIRGLDVHKTPDVVVLALTCPGCWGDNPDACDELRAAAIEGGLESMLAAYRAGVPAADVIAG